MATQKSDDTTQGRTQDFSLGGVSRKNYTSSRCDVTDKVNLDF